MGKNTDISTINWKDYLLWGDQERVRIALIEQYGWDLKRMKVSRYANNLDKKPQKIEGHIIKAALIKVAKANKRKIEAIEAA